MTLDDLRAQFEQESQEYVEFLRDRLNGGWTPLSGGYLMSNAVRLRVRLCDTHFVRPKDIIAEWEDADEDGLCQSRLCYKKEPGVRRAYVAAKILVIAEDEGLDAALLWKLQNGGAL